MNEENKKTIRSEEEKKKLIVRLSKVEGQIRGLKKLLEDDEYCINILVQSSAVIGALTSFEKELLNSHISSCVVNGIKEGREEEVVPEVTEIIGRLLR